MLLTEPPLNPRTNRDIAAQVLFETFNVPALFTSIQAVLSLYASGRTTGIVLDSGDGVSHAVPVYEGFAMPSSIRRIDVAGRDITEHMQLLLRKGGHVFHTSAEKEVVRMIKEKTTYIALDPKKEEKEWLATKGRADGKEVEYTLPDGNKLKVRASLIHIQSSPKIAFSDVDGFLSRSAPNASAHRKSSSTRKSSASSTRVSITWSWTPSTARTWTCASPSSATSFCPAVRR